MSNMFVRGNMPEDNFSIVENDLITNDELSVHARMLMIYVISRPPGWTFRKKDILKILQCGDTVYKRVIDELKDKGFIVLEKPRNDKGHVIGTAYIFTRKTTEAMVSPDSDKTNTRKTTPLSNTDNYNNKEKDTQADKPPATSSKPKTKKASKPNPHWDNIRAELDRRNKHYTPALIGKLIKAMKPHDIEPEQIPDYFTWLDKNKRGLIIEGKSWSWDAKNMSAYVVNWLDATEESKIDEDKFNLRNPLFINHN